LGGGGVGGGRRKRARQGEACVKRSRGCLPLPAARTRHRHRKTPAANVVDDEPGLGGVEDDVVYAGGCRRASACQLAVSSALWQSSKHTGRDLGARNNLGHLGPLAGNRTGACFKSSLTAACTHDPTDRQGQGGGAREQASGEAGRCWLQGGIGTVRLPGSGAPPQAAEARTWQGDGLRVAAIHVLHVELVAVDKRDVLDRREPRFEDVWRGRKRSRLNKGSIEFTQPKPVALPGAPRFRFHAPSRAGGSGKARQGRRMGGGDGGQVGQGQVSGARWRYPHEHAALAASWRGALPARA
jgi:hypothetical protein